MRKNVKILIVSLVLLATSTAFAEEPIVSYEKVELDNGARIICGYLPESPLVTIQIRVLSGLSNEGEYASTGISHFLEHLLFKGTKNKTSKELRKSIKAMGGTINGSTGLDSAEYHIIVPNDKAEEALSLITDMVMQPIFTDAGFDREKSVILKEIKLRDDDPLSRRISLLFSEAYRTHVYKSPIIGEIDKVSKVTREDVANYHSLAYQPDRMVVGIIGGAPLGEITALAKKVFEKYEKGKLYAPEVLTEPPQEEEIVSRFEEDVALGYLTMGFHTTSLYSEDLYPMDVLSILMGEGEDSRLYKKLVKEKELLYTVSSFNYTPRYPGLFIIMGIGEPSKLEEAREEIFAMIEEIKEGGVLEKEVDRAKNRVLSDYLHSHEMAANITSSMTSSEMLVGDPLFFQKYVDEVHGVTPEEVENVLPKYFDRNNSTTVFLVPKDPAGGILADLKLKGGPDKNEIPGVKEEKKVNVKDTQAEVSPQASRNLKEVSSSNLEFQGEEKKDKGQRTKNEDGRTKIETLDNGLKIIVKERSRLPLVSLTFAAEGGLRAERKYNNGISNLTASLLLKGTKTRSEEEIVSSVEKYGGIIETFSGMNSIGMTLDLLSERLEEGLDVLEDVLKNSIFPEEEMLKIKKKIIAFIKEEDNDIFTNGMNNLRKLLYEDDPYSRRIAGEIKTIGDISREDIVMFYRERIVPQGAVITVVGDVDIDKTLEVLKKRFSDWEGEKYEIDNDQPEPIEKEKRKDIDMPKDQALFLSGFQGARIKDDRKYGLSVISAVLSGSDGLLFFFAREKEGITYTSGAVNLPAVDPGYFVTYIATTEENLSAAENIIAEVLEKVRSGDVEEEEISSSKNRLITQDALSLETNSSISMKMALDELYGMGYDDYLNHPGKIRSVTKENIVEIANEILVPSKSAVCIVHSK
ncbi:MAG: pitrilysin family protein [Candidatus Omnitrophota bacterium]